MIFIMILYIYKMMVLHRFDKLQQSPKILKVKKVKTVKILVSKNSPVLKVLNRTVFKKTDVILYN